MNVVPGKMEAEDYSAMNGVTTQKSSDTGGGLFVTSIEAKDWMDYSLEVKQGGKYRIDYRVASASGNGQFELRKTTGIALSVQTVNSTGGVQKWITQSDTISLTSGKQTLRIHAVTGGWNINWINLEYIHPTAIDEISQANPKNSVTVAPNPVNKNFKVTYSLEESAQAELRLIDLKGNIIGKKAISKPIDSQGELDWAFDGEAGPGEYLIALYQNRKKVAECKLIKTE